MNFTVAELAQASRGTLLCGDARQTVRRICIDTRIIQPGEAFLAIKGKNFDGDCFIHEAIRRGAAGIISGFKGTLPEFPESCFFIRVEDGTIALADIAREWRLVVDPIVCAITGSSGKTTTKEMLAHICAGRYTTLATDGNFNNHIGLPLTLLRLEEKHEVAVIETGMNHSGELTSLAGIALPDISVITNIGNAHLGNFGSVENLIRAKAELFEAMPASGTAVINADCPHASIMTEAFRIPEMLISYGQNEKADVQAMNVELVEPFGYTFDLRVLDSVMPVHLAMFGRYQVSNALAAAAAAAAIGVGPELIASRLSDFAAPAMRAETEWIDGIWVVADCYNASPDATIHSLRSLGDIVGSNRRVAVLGDMFELGEHSEKYHRHVGEAVAESGIDYLCTFGSDAHFIFEEAERRGIAARHFEDIDEVANFLHANLGKGDVLIVKGSRALRLERVLLRFRELRSAVQAGELPAPAGGKVELPNA